MGDVDGYASAKATLRDNVKWLAGSFAGLAALILAGTPFTGYGNLETSEPRFIVATFGLVVGLVCLFIGWTMLLRMLRPDVIYPRYLKKNFDPKKKIADRATRDEIIALRAEFERQHVDLLPRPRKYFDQLEKLRKTAWQQWVADQANQGKRSIWQDYHTSARNVLYWASYTVLHYRVTRGFRRIIALGVAIVIAISLFAWAANPPKEQEAAAKSPASVIIDESDGCCTAPPLTERLEPVPFEHAQAKLTSKGWESVNAARDFLRRETAAGVLLLAHTDTTGGPVVNERLARDRVMAVYRALTVEGGIAATRVFIAEFPERDLPVMTPQDTRNDKNRDVEFMVVALPPR